MNLTETKDSLLVRATWTYSKKHKEYRFTIGRAKFATLSRELYSADEEWYYQDHSKGEDEQWVWAGDTLPKAKRKVQRDAERWLRKFLNRPIKIEANELN